MVHVFLAEAAGLAEKLVSYREYRKRAQQELLGLGKLLLGHQHVGEAG
jgi:hypothetical protein